MVKHQVKFETALARKPRRRRHRWDCEAFNHISDWAIDSSWPVVRFFLILTPFLGVGILFYTNHEKKHCESQYQLTRASYDPNSCIEPWSAGFAAARAANGAR